MPKDSIIAERVRDKDALRYGIIAQLGEHLPYKQRVIGSSPIGPINNNNCCLIEYGGIAQLARAHGSYPWCRWFKSSSRYLFTKETVVDCLLFLYYDNNNSYKEDEK